MKQLLQIIAALLITLTVYPQTFTPPSYATIDTNYRSYVNQVMGNNQPNLFIKNLSVENQ